MHAQYMLDKRNTRHRCVQSGMVNNWDWGFLYVDILVEYLHFVTLSQRRNAQRVQQLL